LKIWFDESGIFRLIWRSFLRISWLVCSVAIFCNGFFESLKGAGNSLEYKDEYESPLRLKFPLKKNGVPSFSINFPLSSSVKSTINPNKSHSRQAKKVPTRTTNLSAKKIRQKTLKFSRWKLNIDKVRSLLYNLLFSL
jgi:hypothetical protein